LASLAKGIEWVKMKDPQFFLGCLNWKDYSVSADFLLNTQGNVAVYGRIGSIQENDNPAAGYCLKVSDTGDWELQAAGKIIASGKIAFKKNVWHNLNLEFAGNSIKVLVDKMTIAQVKDETFSA